MPLVVTITSFPESFSSDLIKEGELAKELSVLTGIKYNVIIHPTTQRNDFVKKLIEDIE